MKLAFLLSDIIICSTYDYKLLNRLLITKAFMVNFQDIDLCYL